MSVGDVYRVSLLQSATAGGVVPVENVLWFREVVDHGSGGDIDLGTDILFTMTGTSIWSGGIRGKQSSSHLWIGCTAQRMYPTRDPPRPFNLTPALAGTVGSSFQLPPICSAVTRLQTAFTGRSRVGRVYWSGFWFTTAPGGAIWSADIVAAIQATCTALRARYNGGGTPGHWEWGVWSKKLAGPRPPFNPVAFEPISSTTTDDVVRLQRSRELGVSRRHAGRH